MWKWLDRVIDRFFAVAGALLFSQLPSFILQYRQYLAGARAELQAQLQQVEQVAHANGKTVGQLIEKFSQSSDVDVQGQGTVLHEMLHRLQYLSDLMEQLSSANWMIRPFVFIRHLQRDLFEGTLAHYQPTVNFTFEGLFWAFVGLFFGFLTYALIKSLFRALFRLFRTPTKSTN